MKGPRFTEHTRPRTDRTSTARNTVASVLGNTTCKSHFPVGPEDVKYRHQSDLSFPDPRQPPRLTPGGHLRSPKVRFPSIRRGALRGSRYGPSGSPGPNLKSKPSNKTKKTAERLVSTVFPTHKCLYFFPVNPQSVKCRYSLSTPCLPRYPKTRTGREEGTSDKRTVKNMSTTCSSFISRWSN